MTTINPEPRNATPPTPGDQPTARVADRPDAAELAAAVDRARELMAPLDEDIVRKADALVKSREAFIGAGVREMVRRLKADDAARPVLFEMVEDPLIYAVLLELGIVRPDVTTRVARAMERIRPYVKGHGGDIELVRVESGVVFVRLHGACSGCSMSAATLKDGVEEAVRAAVPEIERVEEVKDGPTSGLVTLTVTAGAHGWLEGPEDESVAEGAPARARIGEADVLLIRREGRVFAYRNACPHQGMPLHDGECDESGTITCPYHGFCFDVSSGECENHPQVQLEPFPVRVEDGRVWVRVPQSAGSDA